MDLKRLTTVLMALGLLVAVGAAVWWASFYGPLTRDIGGDLGDAFGCLYSSRGACGFVSGVAQFGGDTPYNPVSFWIGVGMFAAGVVLRLALKR